MPKAKPIVCDICGRTFAMPRNLGRHKSAAHGIAPKTGKKAAKKGRKAGAKRGGRPATGVAHSLLASFSLDDLAALMKIIRQEVEGRLKAYRDLLG